MTDENLENPEVNSDEIQESLDAARVEAWKAYYALKSGAELEAAEKAYAEEVAAEEEGKFRIPSPDWRTLKPGVRDSALYTETSGYYDEDSDLTWWGRAQRFRRDDWPGSVSRQRTHDARQHGQCHHL